MSTADTKAQIEQVIADFQRQVPALERLKLVFELELRGRGDIQLFRVEVPGPKITRDIASDAKVRLSIPRTEFNELAKDGYEVAFTTTPVTPAARAGGAAEDPVVHLVLKRTVR